MIVKESLSQAQLYLFTLHLSLLLKSGVPLATALEILSQSGEQAIERVADELCRDLMIGVSLSRALRNQPHSFPLDYSHIIRNGEESGQLVACLDRLCEALDQRMRLARLLRGALFYPACLVAASLSMLVLLLFFVLPMLLNVSSQAGVDPPRLTVFLMALSSPRVLVGIACFTVVLWVLVHLGLKHRKIGPLMREFWEEHTPIGRFSTRSRVILCLRNLALSLEVGIDLMRSLRLAQEIAHGSVLLERAFQDVGQLVRNGKSLSYGIAQHSIFPALLSALVEVAEEAGNLELVLAQVSDMFEEELEDTVQILSSVLEPMLLGGMGVVVAVVLLGAFLPIYNLVSL